MSLPFPANPRISIHFLVIPLHFVLFLAIPQISLHFLAIPCREWHGNGKEIQGNAQGNAGICRQLQGN
jgi:hypothetical protein